MAWLALCDCAVVPAWVPPRARAARGTPVYSGLDSGGVCR
uniref:Uncharacterized protein n=1 Tax=Oryza glaberrima TaxID=4538 RepID=I1NQ40_ORYGL